MIRNSEAYLLSVLVNIVSKQYAYRLHNGDCYASASTLFFVRTDTEHWLDGLLYCSRY